jgi:hypothetical protein
MVQLRGGVEVGSAAVVAATEPQGGTQLGSESDPNRATHRIRRARATGRSSSVEEAGRASTPPLPVGSSSGSATSRGSSWIRPPLSSPSHKKTDADGTSRYACRLVHLHHGHPLEWRR